VRSEVLVKSWCLLPLVAALLVPPPALAQEQEFSADPESEALAQEAHEVLLTHCAEAGGADMTRAAESVAVVSDVWARVSAQVESSRKVYLLYWRGVLAQCLDQEERALQDLQSFVGARKGSDLWAGLISDADRRITQLERQVTGPGRVAPGWFVGGGLAAGSAALAVGAAIAWQQSQETATEELYPDVLSNAAFDASLARAQEQSNVSAVMTGAAVGCGVASIVAFVLTATRSKVTGTAFLQAPLVVPTPTGATLTWEGSW
jgi:hypothetical protein